MKKNKKSRGFTFKEFHMEQEACAQKICTEACIFGAILANKLKKASSILELGSGSGLLSLMIAQKNPEMEIHGIEIDLDCCKQSQENHKNFPLENGISFEHADLRLWNSSHDYDWIISNPPFYENKVPSPFEDRRLAKHAESFMPLDFKALLTRMGTSANIALLLSDNQVLEDYINELETLEWRCDHRIKIFDKPSKPSKRQVLFFSKKGQDFGVKYFYIKKEDSSYTDEMKNLLQDYYLAL